MTARHHACETPGSFVLEGLLEEVLTGQGEAVGWLREQGEVLGLPFMDRDGVERGEEGRGRSPHDHNRDYGEVCVWPEVRALRELLPGWGAGRRFVALDLHSARLAGPESERVYQVGAREAEAWAGQQRFGVLLERAAARAPGALPYRAGDDLVFGKGWNAGAAGAEGRTFRSFAGGLPGCVLATTLEVPFAWVRPGTPVTVEGLRALGRAGARAVAAFLRGF